MRLLVDQSRCHVASAAMASMSRFRAGVLRTVLFRFEHANHSTAGAEKGNSYLFRPGILSTQLPLNKIGVQTSL